MLLAFAGSNRIKNELAVKSRLRKLLRFYAQKERLTVMCAEGNRFDELVFDAAVEVNYRLPIPISTVAVAVKPDEIQTHPLIIICDEVRFYTGREYTDSYGDDMVWLKAADMLIVFLEKPEKSNAAACYQYAIDNDIPTINIASDL